MSERFRLPSISASSSEGKIEQISRYLYQLALQLDRLLGEGGDGNGSVIVQTEDAQTMFSRLKPLILQSKDIVENLRSKLESSFVDVDDIEDYVSRWLQPADEGVELGITVDEVFRRIVSYKPDAVVLYQDGKEAARFSGGVLTVAGLVQAQSFNGAYMRTIMPGNDGKIQIQTKFRDFIQGGGYQLFFVLGKNGGGTKYALLQVNRDGNIADSIGAAANWFAAGTNGSIILTAENAEDAFMIVSPEYFEIL